MASVVFENVSKEYADGTRAVSDLSLEVEDGEFVVFVGPSGCGKTTALRMVAGLEQVTHGELRIGDKRVNETEPRLRDVAMVFQNYALYPHMTVFNNIAFPLAAQGVDKDTIDERVNDAARMLDLTDHLKRRPRSLSGGQRQRVAMGRAIVRHPRVFLMDEPLSNLDAKLRVQMRWEISGLQRRLSTTTIYVTHDQVEGMTMGDRIAVMRGGVLQQLGTAEQLYDCPANLFVATFVGSPAMNLFQTTVVASQSHNLALELGDQRLELPAGDYAALAGYRDRAVVMGVRPEHMAQANGRNDGLLLTCQTDFVEYVGSDTYVHIELAGASVDASAAAKNVNQDLPTAAGVAGASDARPIQPGRRALPRDGIVQAIARFSPDVKPEPGERQTIAVRPDKLHFFDVETGLRVG